MTMMLAAVAGVVWNREDLPHSHQPDGFHAPAASVLGQRYKNTFDIWSEIMQQYERQLLKNESEGHIE